jgi:hypothetical protein
LLEEAWFLGRRNLVHHRGYDDCSIDLVHHELRPQGWLHLIGRHVGEFLLQPVCIAHTDEFEAVLLV